VVITRYEDQPSAAIFKKKLERQNVRVYTHRFTRGYPTDVDLVVSDQATARTSTSRPKARSWW
jgi:uncharacterized protein (UPF0371 family)